MAMAIGQSNEAHSACSDGRFPREFFMSSRLVRYTLSELQKVDLPLVFGVKQTLQHAFDPESG